MRLRLPLSKFVIIGCAAITLLYGQRPMSPERIATLQAFSADLHQKRLAERRQVELRAAAAGLPVRRKLLDGRMVEVQRFINGRPLYYITTNLNAAQTVRTDLVWPGGMLGLNLTGAGITAGLWDDGSVLITHQEFEGRVTPADGSAIGSDHPTHVAGTMIASGVVPLARGMAGEASLYSYDWDDDSAEMAAAAAAGLTISNHSYSYIVGWQLNSPKSGWNWWGDVNVSSIEDYFFGFYDNTASDWDQIAVNAPYYLIVAAAGNDRADTGPMPGGEHWISYNGENWVLSTDTRDPDGNFDCLPGGPQVAKNVLVVGAVEDIPAGYTNPDDVLMTSFSSWGPTDDGRIKPDLVANGWQLYSAVALSDVAYDYSSGTSMAAPNVTGSVALLQQHYRQTHSDSLPLAATLRALLIHTADEAGTTTGPDYSHGWGLLNTAESAKLISRDAGAQQIVQELTLNQGNSYSTMVTSADAEPLKVTIAWTDPPGNVPSPQLNPRTPMLVNDLDLRITRENDGQVYYPWRLDVDAPDIAASQDYDNSVDNVEQVFISTPLPGEYTVTVSHKNTLLAGVQDFSMVITGESRPQVLVWEGISGGVDYSGLFIRDTLQASGDVDVTYTTTFPENLLGFDAAFLSFGNFGAALGKTALDVGMATVVQEYLEGGGSLYLEGGDALGEDLAGIDNDTLLSLLGIESVIGGPDNLIDSLMGQTSTITNSMLFTASTQEYSQYIDQYTPGTGTAAFVESNYGTVAVQHAGSYGQRAFVFSYALAGLIDGSSPSTRSDLLAAILDFFLEPTPNTAPQITSAATATATEDELFVYHAMATDAEGDMVAFSFDNKSDWLTIAGEDSLAGIPGEGITGGNFRVIASDGQLNDSLMVNINVNPINDPPQITSAATATATEHELFVYRATAADPDGDSVSFTFDSLSAWLTDVGPDSVAGIPGEGITGGGFRVIASDGQLNDSLEVTITVNSVNDAPIAVNDTVKTDEDKVVTLSALVNDRDPDGDEFYLADTTWLAHHGQVSVFFIDTVGVAGTVFIYIPDSDFFGSDSFSYSITDGVLFDTALVLITVTPVNDPPGPFTLLNPASDSTIVITGETLNDTLTVAWEEALDIDGDAVRYRFDATGTLAAIFPSGDTSATELKLAYSGLVPLIREAGESGQVAGTWTIKATDGSDTTRAANGPFSLTLDISRLGIDSQGDVPKEFALQQNYPNPFNPSTTLRFALPREVKVRLVVVDLLGREIVRLVDETLPAGFHRVVWNGKTRRGKEAPSGVYIVRMLFPPTTGAVPGSIYQIKMVLLR
ncbi:MAG: S8 family serine peptidase [Fidelibacterota bacterium]|nr:MAG: S8 family serine peptidase [Candidatus Neomarinimicrobiota bacterium]